MDKLTMYRRLKDAIPSTAQYYNLINICVSRYEINVLKYDITREDKYKLILHAIEKILDNFIDIDFPNINVC